MRVYRDSEESLLEVSFNHPQKLLRSGYCLSGLCIADDGHMVEGIVALAAHSVKQDERRGWTSGQIFLRELDDCDVVTELFAWPPSVAEHESQRALIIGS